MHDVLKPHQPDFQDRPMLRKIWTEVFGDPPDLVDLFYAYFPPEESAWVLRSGHEIVSVAYLVTGNLFVSGENQRRAAYIYAVATQKLHRSNGYSGQLMRYLAQLAEENDYLLYTSPAEQSLFPWYEKHIHTKRASFLRLDSAVLQPSDLLPITHLSSTEYGVKREHFLRDQPHIAASAQFLALQEAFLKREGGGFYAVGACCCACERADNSVRIKEIHGPDQEVHAAIQSIMRRFEVETALVPVSDDAGKATVAYRAAEDLQAANWGFLLD